MAQTLTNDQCVFGCGTAKGLAHDCPYAERWYQTHARPAEELYVIELPNCSIATYRGVTAVSSDREVMVAVVARYSGTSGPRKGWTVRPLSFEEGDAVTRLTLADVERML